MLATERTPNYDSITIKEKRKYGWCLDNDCSTRSAKDWSVPLAL